MIHLLRSSLNLWIHSHLKTCNVLTLALGHLDLLYHLTTYLLLFNFVNGDYNRHVILFNILSPVLVENAEYPHYSISYLCEFFSHTACPM